MRRTVLSNADKPSSAKYSHCIGISTDLAAVSALTVNKPSDGGQSTRIKSKSPLTSESILSRIFSKEVLNFFCRESKSEVLNSATFIGLSFNN